MREMKACDGGTRGLDTHERFVINGHEPWMGDEAEVERKKIRKGFNSYTIQPGLGNLRDETTGDYDVV